MPDEWKVTPALDKAGTGRAIIVPVKALGGKPVSLRQLGERFGLHPDRLLSALLFDERNRLAAANLHMTGETSAAPAWKPDMSEKQVEEALAWRRERSVRPDRDAHGYLQLAAPEFADWQVVPEATVYVPLHERLAPQVKASGLLSLSKRILVIDEAKERLEGVLDDLELKIDRAGRAGRAEVDYLLRVKREQAVLTWMDWVAYAMLQESKENRRSHSDAAVEKTREVRQRLRGYRSALEDHLLERPHRVLKGDFPSGEGVLGGAAARLVDALAGDNAATLIGDIARSPEQVPFELWWRLQSALFRAANVLADAWEPVRVDAYERLVAPALAAIATGWREGASDLQPLDAERPKIAAAVRASWPAAAGPSAPKGAFAAAISNVKSWTGLAKKVAGLTSTWLTLCERWSGELIARLAADADDRETLAGIFYKLAVGTVDPPSAWRRHLAEALTDQDDERRMRRMLLEGKRAGLGFKTATSLLATTSLVLSLRDDPKLSLKNVSSGLSAISGAGELVEDVVALVRRVDDADLFGFKTLGKFAGAVGVISSAVDAKGTYDAGDRLGGHLAVTKTALAAAGLLVTGPLGVVLVAADLAISYVEWNREINRGGGGRAFLALLDRLETSSGADQTLTARVLAVPALLDDHPGDLVTVAKKVRELYFEAAWWDLTADAGKSLLRARVPLWAVKLAVGSTPWPPSDPTYEEGETVLALDIDTWKKTTVVRAFPSHTEWKYELKVRSASWAEDALCPYFEKGSKVNSLWPLGVAKVEKVDLAGGHYDLTLVESGEAFERPFSEVRNRLWSAG